MPVAAPQHPSHVFIQPFCCSASPAITPALCEQLYSQVAGEQDSKGELPKYSLQTTLTPCAKERLESERKVLGGKQIARCRERRKVMEKCR